MMYKYKPVTGSMKIMTFTCTNYYKYNCNLFSSTISCNRYKGLGNRGNF